MDNMIKQFRILYEGPRSVGIIVLPGLSEYSARRAFIRTHPGFNIIEVWSEV